MENPYFYQTNALLMIFSFEFVYVLINKKSRHILHVHLCYVVCIITKKNNGHDPNGADSNVYFSHTVNNFLTKPMVTLTRRVVNAAYVAPVKLGGR